MVMKFHIMVFWVLMSCSDVVGYQHFGGPCYFQLQGEVEAVCISEKLAGSIFRMK
jgi:hypothetical protein